MMMIITGKTITKNVVKIQCIIYAVEKNLEDHQPEELYGCIISNLYYNRLHKNPVVVDRSKGKPAPILPQVK